jgi:hypothetical protein
MSLSGGYSMMETTGEGSGWLRIKKHTRFVHGIFYDLRSCGTGQRAMLLT